MEKETKKAKGQPTGAMKPKKLTNSELIRQIAKLESIIKESVVFVPRSDNTKVFYNERNGIHITVTDQYAVVMSASSRRIFPINAMIYPWLYTYVDIMLDKELDYDKDRIDAVKKNVERFLYLLFDTDSNLSNPISMVLDWFYWLAKNISLLENKGKEVKLKEVTIDVINGMISELIIAKEGITIDSDEATAILNEVKDKVADFIAKLGVELDAKGCKFNDAVVIEASEITETEAMAEMMYDDQLKKEIAEEEI